MGSFSLADRLVELPLCLFPQGFGGFFSTFLNIDFQKTASNVAYLSGQWLKKFLGLNRKDK